jgi:replication factor C small subunit
MNKKYLWVEKYRPTTISDVIFETKKKEDFFRTIVSTKRLPNLLLSGVQGSGKTTISQVLCAELNIHPSDIMLVKCSDETGVENIRDNVSRFANTMPLGDLRIVRLEECDFLSINSQAILRHVIEDSSDTCRFIMTCNYSNKIMPALKSRVQEFTFKAPSQDKVFELMIEILEKENISISSDDEINTLEKIVIATYPDIRKTIQVLQQNTASGKLVLVTNADETKSEDYKLQLISLLQEGDFTKSRKLVVENVQREEYDDFFKWMYQNLNKIPKFSDTSNEEKAIVVINDHLDKHSRVAHPDINVAAMLINLSQI